MPKSAERLTNAKTVGAIRTPGQHNLGDGLFLRVRMRKDGKLIRTFLVRKRDNALCPVNGGKEIVVSLGDFNTLSLKEAHFKADEISFAVNEGRSPFPNQLRPQQGKKSLSVTQIFERWIQAKTTEWKDPVKKSRDYRNSFTAYLPETLRGLHAERIKTIDIAQGIAERWHSNPESARKLCQGLRAAFTLAKAEQTIRRQDNPVDLPAITLINGRQAKSRNKQPALPTEEIPVFFAALFKDHAFSVAGHMVAYAILTASRLQPVILAKRSAIQERHGIPVHVFPREDQKTENDGSSRLVPLSQQALLIIKRMRMFCESEFLFPNIQNRARHHLSKNAHYKLLNTMNAERLEAEGRGWIDVQQFDAEGKARRMSLHGTARASFADWAASARRYGHEAWDDKLIQRCLDHAEDLGGAYKRDPMLEELRPIFEQWGAYCFSQIDQIEE